MSTCCFCEKEFSDEVRLWEGPTGVFACGECLKKLHAEFQLDRRPPRNEYEAWHRNFEAVALALEAGKIEMPKTSPSPKVERLLKSLGLNPVSQKRRMVELHYVVHPYEASVNSSTWYGGLKEDCDPNSSRDMVVKIDPSFSKRTAARLLRELADGLETRGDIEDEGSGDPLDYPERAADWPMDC